jgi:hypothetical protein
MIRAEQWRGCTKHRVRATGISNNLMLAANCERVDSGYCAIHFDLVDFLYAHSAAVRGVHSLAN